METFKAHGITWNKKSGPMPQVPYNFMVLYKDELEVESVFYIQEIIFKKYPSELLKDFWNDDDLVGYSFVNYD